MSLTDYGWCDHFSKQFEEYRRQGLEPGRVTEVQRGLYRVLTESGEFPARSAGRLRQQAEQGDTASLPVVGDWVALSAEGESGIIHAITTRRSLLSRKTPGTKTAQQPIAANVDTVFLVMGLDHDFNLRRIERFLVLSYESGVLPVVILNKADVASDLDSMAMQVESVAPGVRVIPVSAVSGFGVDQLLSYMTAGQTVALLGSSGVGKSTLINRLFGSELMRTGPVRESDGRGTHTTTHRQMLRHPAGGLLIDNPGLRELQLWGSEEALGPTYEDIETLAVDCRYRDCRHDGEPGCAVARAVSEGRLAEERLQSHHKLARELRYLAVKQDENAQRAEKQKWKAIHKAMRHNPKG